MVSKHRTQRMDPRRLARHSRGIPETLHSPVEAGLDRAATKTEA